MRETIYIYINIRYIYILIYSQKICYAGYKISANYSLFSTSNLIEIKQYQFSWPAIELAKLNMRKDYVLLMFNKSKIK